METVLVAGLFGLLGAVVGSVLTGLVQRTLQVQTARSDRIDSAIRSLAVALASANFIWSAGMAGAPPSLTEEDEAENARTNYLRGVERYLVSLHEAKRDLAIIKADGVDSGMNVDILRENPSLDELQIAYTTLTRLRSVKRRA